MLAIITVVWLVFTGGLLFSLTMLEKFRWEKSPGESSVNNLGRSSGRGEPKDKGR